MQNRTLSLSADACKTSGQVHMTPVRVAVAIAVVGFVAGALLWLSGSYAAHVPYARWYVHAAPALAATVSMFGVLLAALVWRSKAVAQRIKAQANHTTV